MNRRRSKDQNVWPGNEASDGNMYHDSCKTVGEQLWQEREGGCAQHGRPNTFCHPQQDTEEDEHPTTGHHGSKTVCNHKGEEYL